MKTIPLLWTNDDIGPGGAEPLQRQLDFLHRHSLRGVFFVVPKAAATGQTIADDVALLRCIERARAAGHEFYQHGFIHSPFESGVPETWMLDFAPDVRRQYDERRLEVEAGHTLEALTAMLDEGQRIWQQAFHEPSPGYRPGWGALCRNLFQALDARGYSFSSSFIPGRTSWMWCQGNWDFPLEFLREPVPARPFYIGKSLLEIPMTGGDYAFGVPNDPTKMNRMVDLAVQEFNYCWERNLPFVLLSHYHGLACDGGAGYTIHDRILPKLLESGRAEPLGMAALHRCYARSPAGDLQKT